MQRDEKKIGKMSEKNMSEFKTDNDSRYTVTGMRNLNCVN